MYLSGFWGSDPEIVDNWSKRGTYYLLSHGEVKDWIISSDKPDDESEGLLWSVPYNGERYFYELDFYTYGYYKDTLLYQKMKSCTLIKTQQQEIYLYLTNDKIPTYQNDMLDEMESDELGGEINEADLNTFTTKHWRSSHDIINEQLNKLKIEHDQKEEEKYNFSLFDM